MSEILLKKIEFPKEGTLTLLITSSGEVYRIPRKYDHIMTVSVTESKAIELPPHGDLKDVNKIIEDIKKHHCHNSRFCDERCSCCDFAEIISVIDHDIPTVLEAIE